jgi:hypothetical protein
MKKILLSISFLFVFGAMLAQSRCVRPLSSVEFNQRKQMVTSVGNEARKLQVAIRVSQENCLTATQIKEIALLLNDEFNRLDYTQKAYATVFDPENYYEVYDVFSRFSMAIRLYDFVNGRNTSNPVVINPNPTNPNPTNPNNPNFNNYPNYQYPSSDNYMGAKNCSAPISEAVFESVAQRVRTTTAMLNKLNLARQAVQNNCLSVSQAMRLVSLVPEGSRLELLRSAYPNIFDVENLPAASQVFEIRTNQDQWQAFLSQNSVGNNPASPIGNACEVSANEYNIMLATLHKEISDFGKMNLMKNIVSNHCFTVEQVRGIVKLYTSDSSRLEAAKFLYDYTVPTEKRQYFAVANELTFSSNRAELSNFLAQKNR